MNAYAIDSKSLWCDYYVSIYWCWRLVSYSCSNLFFIYNLDRRICYETQNTALWVRCVCPRVCVFRIYCWFVCFWVCWSSAIAIKYQHSFWLLAVGLTFTYCICGWKCCWCWCEYVWITCCWTGRLWARCKTWLTHWLLTYLTNFQLQTLLIWKYITVFDLFFFFQNVEFNTIFLSRTKIKLA